MSYEAHVQQIREYESDPIAFRKKEYQRKLAELEQSANAAGKITDPMLRERVLKGVEGQREELRQAYADVIEK